MTITRRCSFPVQPDDQKMNIMNTGLILVACMQCAYLKNQKEHMIVQIMLLEVASNSADCRQKDCVVISKALNSGACRYLGPNLCFKRWPDHTLCGTQEAACYYICKRVEASKSTPMRQALLHTPCSKLHSIILPSGEHCCAETLWRSSQQHSSQISIMDVSS